MTGALALPVIRPIPARTLVAGLSVVLLLSALFAYFVQVPRREDVTGWLEPLGGEIRVMAPHQGVVMSLAPSGEDVAQGAALVLLRDTRGPANVPAVAAVASSPESGARVATVHISEITAPMNVNVLANAVSMGSSVSEGQLLALLAPKQVPLQALLQVPADAAANIRPGQTVELRMAAYPFETYGPVQALVDHVDRTAMSAADAPRLNRATTTEPMVLATATLQLVPQISSDGQLHPIELHSGMKFRASVEVERRTLLSWLLWPLLRNFH
jgi:hypothetical protein